MILLNPKHPDRPGDDARTRELMRQTIDFFENKGKKRLLEDPHLVMDAYLDLTQGTLG